MDAVFAVMNVVWLALIVSTRLRVGLVPLLADSADVLRDCHRGAAAWIGKRRPETADV